MLLSSPIALTKVPDLYGMRVRTYVGQRCAPTWARGAHLRGSEVRTYRGQRCAPTGVKGAHLHGSEVRTKWLHPSGILPLNVVVALSLRAAAANGRLADPPLPNDALPAGNGQDPYGQRPFQVPLCTCFSV